MLGLTQTSVVPNAHTTTTTLHIRALKGPATTKFAPTPIAAHNVGMSTPNVSLSEEGAKGSTQNGGEAHGTSTFPSTNENVATTYHPKPTPPSHVSNPQLQRFRQ